MLDVKIVRRGEIWQYNPAIRDYTDDDVFHAISGTPAIASDKLRLNGDEIITYGTVFQFGSLEFYLTIPAVPTTGDVRQFGFKNNGDLGKMIFDVTDDVFSAKVYDAAGTIIDTKTIEWDSTWTAAEARFRITWEDRNIIFAVDDVIVATFNAGFDKDIIDSDIMNKFPMNGYLKNTNADNLDCSLIQYR